MKRHLTTEAIRRVMVAAYQVEAAILGVEAFVPLYRTAAHIAATDAVFYGIFDADRLVAVAEIEETLPHAHLDSLVVLPGYFRRGLASRLLQRIGEEYGGGEITVATGLANAPALQLYARHGFHERQRWTTKDGIPMVTQVMAAPAR